MGYDSVANNIVMLGGQTFPTSAGAGAIQTLNDGWTLDSLGWHQDHLVPDPTPGAIAQDPRTGQLIMVGSPLPTGLASQTWIWDGSAWRRLADLPAPTDRVVGLAPLADRLVLVTENSQVTATQTWAWTGSTWLLRHPITNLPLGAAGPVIAPDPRRHRIIAVLVAAPTRAARRRRGHGMDRRGYSCHRPSSSASTPHQPTWHRIPRPERSSCTCTRTAQSPAPGH